MGFNGESEGGTIKIHIIFLTDNFFILCLPKFHETRPGDQCYGKKTQKEFTKASLPTAAEIRKVVTKLCQMIDSDVAVDAIVDALANTRLR